MRVSKSHPLVKRVLAATFPEYRGRKVRVEEYTRPRRWTVCWDEGSRDEVKMIDLARGVAELTSGSPWTNPEGVLALVDQPAGSILVVHSIFCGVDAGITIIVRDIEPIRLPGHPTLDQHAITAGLLGAGGAS